MEQFNPSTQLLEHKDVIVAFMDPILLENQYLTEKQQATVQAKRDWATNIMAEAMEQGRAQAVVRALNAVADNDFNVSLKLVITLSEKTKNDQSKSTVLQFGQALIEEDYDRPDADRLITKENILDFMDVNKNRIEAAAPVIGERALSANGVIEEIPPCTITNEEREKILKRASVVSFGQAIDLLANSPRDPEIDRMHDAYVLKRAATLNPASAVRLLAEAQALTAKGETSIAIAHDMHLAKYAATINPYSAVIFLASVEVKSIKGAETINLLHDHYIVVHAAKINPVSAVKYLAESHARTPKGSAEIYADHDKYIMRYAHAINVQSALKYLKAAQPKTELGRRTAQTFIARYSR